MARIASIPPFAVRSSVFTCILVATIQNTSTASTIGYSTNVGITNVYSAGFEQGGLEYQGFETGPFRLKQQRQFIQSAGSEINFVAGTKLTQGPSQNASENEMLFYPSERTPWANGMPWTTSNDVEFQLVSYGCPPLSVSPIPIAGQSFCSTPAFDGAGSPIYQATYDEFLEHYVLSSASTDLNSSEVKAYSEVKINASTKTSVAQGAVASSTAFYDETIRITPVDRETFVTVDVNIEGYLSAEVDAASVDFATSRVSSSLSIFSFTGGRSDSDYDASIRLGKLVNPTFTDGSFFRDAIREINTLTYMLPAFTEAFQIAHTLTTQTAVGTGTLLGNTVWAEADFDDSSWITLSFSEALASTSDSGVFLTNPRPNIGTVTERPHFPVPVPASVALLALGLAGLCWKRRGALTELTLSKM